ncbi:MAG TPA: sigma-70 family RNA polymerase sigma factor, partial [Gaiellaceae bacterium]|nr:sigma-70 family RNA polymerase sigma factor [Gaiellaceae bacterium]
RTRRALTQRLNHEPTNEEIAAEVGFTPERVADLLELVAHPVSLETPVGDGESMVADLIEDERAESPDQATADSARHTELEAALNSLEPRMRYVLARRYGLDGEASQTLEELGSDLGITRERVRQLENKALRELRRTAPSLKLYLQV